MAKQGNQLSFTQRQYIESWAQEILLKYYQHICEPITLPIPIFDIAADYFNLKVDFEHFPEAFGGLSAVINAEKDWIILNRNQDIVRQRFSVGHEVGHWLIGNDEFSTMGDVAEGTNSWATSNPRFEENAVDYFAGALLMPKPLIEYYHGRFNWHDEKGKQRFADLFGVSVAALGIRIKQIESLLPTNNELKVRILNLLSKDEYPSSPERDQSYRLVIPTARYFDHRLARFLTSHNKDVYVVIEKDRPEMIDVILEFKLVDRFVVVPNIDKYPVSEFFQMADVEIVDLRHFDDYYRDKDYEDETSNQFDESQEIVQTRDTDECVEAKQLPFAAIKDYLCPEIIVHEKKDARTFIRQSQSDGKRVIVVTGCFDLLTDKHIRFLRGAKARGDVLVVGIESDRRVQYFKGHRRPVNTIAQRVEVLEGLNAVDFTFAIKGSSAIDLEIFYTLLHKYLRADALAITEGDPHTSERKREIEAAGGVLELIPNSIQDGATTSLLRTFLAKTVDEDIVYLKKSLVDQLTDDVDDNWTQPHLPL